MDLYLTIVWYVVKWVILIYLGVVVGSSVIAHTVEIIARGYVSFIDTSRKESYLQAEEIALSLQEILYNTYNYLHISTVVSNFVITIMSLTVLLNPRKVEEVAEEIVLNLSVFQ